MPPGLKIEVPQVSEQGFSEFMKSTGLPTAKEVEEKGTTLLKEERASRKPLEERNTANIQKMFENAKALKDSATPQPPKLKDLQEAPDEHYKDPTQALGSLASVIAILGSFKTRAPLTSALNASAAAMDAFQKGDMERVKLEREKWHDNLEMGLRQNQIEMDRYTNALTAAKFDFEKARPMFEAIAAETNNNAMLLAVQHGDYRTMHDIYNGALKAQEKIVDLYVKDQDKRLQIAAHHDEVRLRTEAMAQQHRENEATRAAIREQTQAWKEGQRGDINTRWFIATAQRQVKPYQDTIRRANDIESNLIPGMQMPDTVKIQLKQLAGTRQVGRWTQGLDKNTGDLITRIFSKVQAGTMGTLSQQDADAMKAFTANIKAINAQEIDNLKRSMKPYADQYKIPEPIFNIPFSVSAPMGDMDVAYPGLDQSTAGALGIVDEMIGR